MSTGVTITLIICATLIILSSINAITTNKQRKEAKTIFNDIFKSKGE